MPKIPLPNLRINYYGLMQTKFIKKRFQNFSLGHAYRSTYSFGSYVNSLDYIENDTRKPNELKEFFKSKYPDHYYLMAESDTKSDWWGETSGVSICVEMYLIAYIHIKKPMTILEYGSGKSTYIMSKVMTDLNYGGSLITFEDSEDFYKISQMF